MNSQLQQFLFNGDQFIKATFFKVGDASISLLWLLKLTLVFLIVIILSTLLKRLLKHRLLRLHPDLAEGFAHEMTKETEIYQNVRQQLQDMGLLGMTEHHFQFTEWVQARLKNLFSARSPFAKSTIPDFPPPPAEPN
ncbi:hypothetical protein [Nostoc sp.]|uniref:hypothetical protein n=1 Tax=Nostoc sp. TaxID=1180 RepID=UPI002FF548E3